MLETDPPIGEGMSLTACYASLALANTANTLLLHAACL